MAKKILVAEDSITLQKVFQMTFAAEDFDVTSVSKGEEVIFRAKELKPDLVIADISLEGKSGYDISADIKADPSLATIPVLLLHGTSTPLDSAKLKVVKADGDVVKPFETQVLIEQVKSVIDSVQSLGPAVNDRIGPVQALAPLIGSKVGEAASEPSSTHESPVSIKSPSASAFPLAAKGPSVGTGGVTQESGAFRPTGVPVRSPTGPVARPSPFTGAPGRPMGGQQLPKPGISPSRPGASSAHPSSLLSSLVNKPAASSPPATKGTGTDSDMWSRPGMGSAPGSSGVSPLSKFGGAVGGGISSPSAKSAGMSSSISGLSSLSKRAGAPSIAGSSSTLSKGPLGYPTTSGNPPESAQGVEITIEAEPPPGQIREPLPSFETIQQPTGRLSATIESTRERSQATKLGLGKPGLPPPPAGMPLPPSFGGSPAIAKTGPARPTDSKEAIDPAVYEAVVKLSKEVIERIVWEIVPDLAERIIREELDRLVETRRSR